MLWGSLHAAGDAIFFNPLRCSGANRPETRVFKFRLEAFDASLGIREGFLVLLPPHKAPGNRSTFTSHNSLEKRSSFCLLETHGKDEFPQTVQVLHTQFRLFGTFTLVNTNSCQTVRLSLMQPLAKGEITSLPSRSGEGVFVVVNVYFEPDLVLRVLLERLHRISLHCPRYLRSP